MKYSAEVKLRNYSTCTDIGEFPKIYIMPKKGTKNAHTMV